MQKIENKNILQELKDLRDKLDSIIETLEIMSDEELVESIKKAEKDIEEGRLINYFELTKELGIRD
ncbi:hypothetical protein DRP05_15590 [Archaeoglobales archaeon]|nr:MAG: hypothetical protein DRP05_15590 [Archaeoglobales archaeon]